MGVWVEAGDVAGDSRIGGNGNAATRVIDATAFLGDDTGDEDFGEVESAGEIKKRAALIGGHIAKEVGGSDVQRSRSAG